MRKNYHIKLNHIVDVTYNDLTGDQKQELFRNIHLLSNDNEVMYILEGEGRYSPLWQELSNVFDKSLGYYGTKEALTFSFFQTLERVLPSIYKDQADFMYDKYGYPRGARLFNRETAQEVRTYNIKIVCGAESLKILIDVLDRSNLLSYLEISK